MKTIYKYELAIEDTQEIMLPIGAQILCVQMQGKSPQLWAIIDPHAPKEPRVIDIYGTGHPLGDYRLLPLPKPKEDPGKYIGTFQQYEGQLVWHVFERMP